MTTSGRQLPRHRRGRRGGPDRSPPPLAPEPEQGLAQELMEDEGEGDQGNQTPHVP